MNTLPKIKKKKKKIHTTKRVTSNQIIREKRLYINVLSRQIIAMAAQDNSCPIGKRLDIFA